MDDETDVPLVWRVLMAAVLFAMFLALGMWLGT